MRESIGTSFMLNFIILFIFLVFAFLAGTFSYYKAYKINNYIVNTIEKYEGYNSYSSAEILEILRTIGYETTVDINCPATWQSKGSAYFTSAGLDQYNLVGKKVSPDGLGYCVYLFMNDGASLADSATGSFATTDVYYRYGVLTYMKFKFPLLENALKIPIFSSTDRIYCFEGNDSSGTNVCIYYYNNL